jgi:hypothetical protein
LTQAYFATAAKHADFSAEASQRLASFKFVTHNKNIASKSFHDLPVTVAAGL